MAFPAPHEGVNLPLPDPEAYPGEPREYATALMQRKDEIEKEIDALKDVLASHNATTDTPLVDPEGYPRGDIDVYAIRHARAALARLYNDRSEVTRRLATALEQAFQPGASSSNGATAPAAPAAPPAAAINGHRDNADASDIPDVWPDRPIALVNSVADNSPAAAAGLQARDVIYSFSGITAASPGGMQAIGPVVARSEGSPLTLLVQRGNERKLIRLTPRSGWGGRGLLGCHIVPP
ncbi:26S proteasome non-ATPase regulatory subunit 9 [Vanrija pseudolonga]|uniref:Probable 26S proteasome regulatory subunit p27 n=1 Tax=Vanrija pseudolonga TaxID=143232 RepID=A0AAF0Y6U0_9TREE|nr:26S proteasome non-ATPase regulatory subunit 9 [Vanrija pseudolonga]